LYRQNFFRFVILSGAPERSEKSKDLHRNAMPFEILIQQIKETADRREAPPTACETSANC
jgi:hypothetical protein